MGWRTLPFFPALPPGRARVPQSRRSAYSSSDRLSGVSVASPLAAMATPQARYPTAMRDRRKCRRSPCGERAVSVRWCWCGEFWGSGTDVPPPHQSRNTSVRSACGPSTNVIRASAACRRPPLSRLQPIRSAPRPRRFLPHIATTPFSSPTSSQAPPIPGKRQHGYTVYGSQGTHGRADPARDKKTDLPRS